MSWLPYRSGTEYPSSSALTEISIQCQVYIEGTVRKESKETGRLHIWQRSYKHLKVMNDIYNIQLRPATKMDAQIVGGAQEIVKEKAHGIQVLL